ncbi:MAG: hypothetical protein ABIH26_10940 [Candidatus Eisenbacteria bacterium]
MTDQPEKTVVERSRDMISQLKQMRHDAETNIKKLTELWLVLEDELQQKEYAGRVKELSSHQNALHGAIESLISDYEMECNRMESEAS